jgi:iron complex transport system substrate-binding protein
MRRTLALAVVAALGITACGSSDSADTTQAPADTATSTETIETSSSTEAPPAGDTTEADGGAFPVTIEHKYGETTIEAEPQRVVSVGFGEHDGLLALGVVPVGVRDWYGDQPFATWPWAQDELGDAEPVVLSSAEKEFEAIAALQPDLILGISSGMTDADYELLSQIAPTIAQPADYIDFGTPWDVALEITGRAVGRSDVATQVIADTRQLFSDAIEAHPEFAGATATTAFFFEEQPGAYVSSDIRSRLLTDLGFVIPEEIDDLAGGSFFLSISAEDLSLIDTDVVVWIGSDEASFASIRDLPTRPALRAFSEGREVVADELLSGALSHSSPLSLEYALEILVPELALAVDGDPSTAVPSAALIGGDEAVPTAETSGDAEQAATDVWTLVFDSDVPFADKAAHIEDAEALQATIETYTENGSMMGGISLVPTDVAVSGDSATVTYDVLFGDTVAYDTITGEIELVDGTWVVSRAEFCSFMASARIDCPAG